jgi:hypothetical protein
LRELLNAEAVESVRWPPQGGTEPLDTRKVAFASSPELVTVKSIGMAENVAEVLKLNAGQNLRDLGMLWAAVGE